MATRYIIRVQNTDLNGEKKIGYALCKIKGVSVSFSHALCHVAGINPNIKAGDLSDAQEARLSELLTKPRQAGIPEWMFNRRKDPETGEDVHLIGSDVKFARDNDIKFERKIRTYKGQRHAVNLPVRGQRTKSHFRRQRKKQVSKKARGGQ